MSDSTTTSSVETPSVTKETPATEKNVSSETPRVDNPVQKNTAEGNEDSLAKLLKHINELQAENSELEEAMKLVREGNLSKLKANIAEKIQPWVEQLNIPVDQKESFIAGITNAAQMGTGKTLNGFEENPIYTVVCSAAAAHGAAIFELENTRKKLAEVENQHQNVIMDHEKKISDRAEEMLYASSNRDSNSRKRSHEDVSESTMQSSSNDIWDAMFTTMRNQNGRFS